MKEINSDISENSKKKEISIGNIILLISITAALSSIFLYNASATSWWLIHIISMIFLGLMVIVIPLFMIWAYMVLAVRSMIEFDMYKPPENQPEDLWEYPSVYPEIDGRLRDVLISFYRKRSLSWYWELYGIQESELIEYKNEKVQFSSKKEALIALFASDIVSREIRAKDIIEITDMIRTFVSSLQKLTNTLIRIMPSDTFVIEAYPDPDMFRDMLFEENSWLEDEALSMQYIFNEWLKNHLQEVAWEKIKLEALLKTEWANIANLVNTTGTILRNSLQKVIVTV